MVIGRLLYHIDENQRNTVKENIMFLCIICHNRLHHGGVILKERYQRKVLNILKNR